MSLRTLIWERRSDWVAPGLAAVAAGVLVGLTGPFDSDAIAPGIRVFYSITVSVVGAVVFWPTMRFAWAAGRRAGWSPWASGLAAGAALSVPVWLLSSALLPILWLDPAPRPPEPAKAFFHTLLFLTPTVLIATYLHVLHTSARRSAPVANPDELPPLFRRLPPALGRDVLALEAQDHYVRVHTAAGSTLVHSRLADAIAGVGEIQGMRVHRSWWVARQAVRAARVERRRLSLVLVNGLTAPVSRQAAPAVRREGWAKRAAPPPPADRIA